LSKIYFFFEGGLYLAALAVHSCYSLILDSYPGNPEGKNVPDPKWSLGRTAMYIFQSLQELSIVYQKDLSFFLDFGKKNYNEFLDKFTIVNTFMLTTLEKIAIPNYHVFKDFVKFNKFTKPEPSYVLEINESEIRKDALELLSFSLNFFSLSPYHLGKTFLDILNVTTPMSSPETLREQRDYYFSLAFSQYITLEYIHGTYRQFWDKVIDLMKVSLFKLRSIEVRILASNFDDLLLDNDNNGKSFF
jgi:hypothetical protein